MDTLIITANGDGKRWEQDESRYPKQLALIKGEPIILRAIRLAWEFGAKKVFVVTGDPRITDAVKGVCDTLSIGPTKNLAGTFLASRPCWSGDTAILFGDIIFTRAALRTISQAKTGHFIFWGKKKFHGETIGFTFGEAEFDIMQHYLEYAVKLAATPRGQSYQLDNVTLHVAYRRYSGLDDFFYNYENVGVYQEILDDTTDVDQVKDYEEFVDKLEKGIYKIDD